jgi:hypothetical protein
VPKKDALLRKGKLLEPAVRPLDIAELSKPGRQYIGYSRTLNDITTTTQTTVLRGFSELQWDYIYVLNGFIWGRIDTDAAAGTTSLRITADNVTLDTATFNEPNSVVGRDFVWEVYYVITAISAFGIEQTNNSGFTRRLGANNDSPNVFAFVNSSGWPEVGGNVEFEVTLQTSDAGTVMRDLNGTLTIDAYPMDLINHMGDTYQDIF